MKNNNSRINKFSDSNGDLNENGISEPNISEIRHGLEALDDLMNKYLEVGGNKIKNTAIQSLNEEVTRKNGGITTITYKRNLDEEYIPGGETNKSQSKHNGRRASSRNSNEKLDKNEYNQSYYSELSKEMRKKKVKSDGVLEAVKYNEKKFGLSKSKFRLSEAELTVVNGGSNLKLNRNSINRSTFSEEEPSILLDRSFDRDNSLNLDDDITFSKIESMLIEPQKRMEPIYQNPSSIQVDKKIKQDRGDLSTSFLEGISNVRENSIDDLNEIPFDKHLNNKKLDIRLEDDILHNLSLPEKLFKFNLSSNNGEAFDILENKETDKMFYNKSETELLTINRKKEGINQSQVNLTAAQKLKVELQNIELETKKVNIDRILNKNYYGNYNAQHSTPLSSKRNYTSNDKIEFSGKYN
ncbi:hypothetical protein K502DRAFT_179111 [Neoconidiobolus thromboides FSU 785]|nr:hypothetical protein K502DRAFT_179111 [Neoconidiobolus thromboides FSU 785]